jgi:hypothetical protein
MGARFDYIVGLISYRVSPYLFPYSHYSMKNNPCGATVKPLVSLRFDFHVALLGISRWGSRGFGRFALVSGCWLLVAGSLLTTINPQAEGFLCHQQNHLSRPFL